MKTVLITGAHGQDGIILSKIFLKKKYKVFGIVKKYKRLIPGVTYIVNNLRSKKKVSKILSKTKPSIIIHLAAINNTYYFRKKENYKNNYFLNLACTKNLISSAVKINFSKFIFAGSSLMFKSQKKIKVNEDSRLESKDFYGRYKIESLKYLQKVSKKYNLNSTTVLLFNHDSIYRNEKFLLPRLIKAFIRKDRNFIERIFSLNISGDFSDAEAICNGIYKLSIYKKKVDKLILSSGKRFYINRVINYLCKKFSLQIKKDKKNLNANYKILGSNKLAKKLLKFKNEKNLFNTIDKIVDNYKKIN